MGAISLTGSLIGCLRSAECESFGVGGEVAVNACWQLNRDLDRFVIVDSAEFELGHLCHPPYGSRTRSRLTITRTGNPGLIVSVG